MIQLPTDAEQSWLLSHLANLIRIQGWQPFILNPVIEPTVRFFPTRWTNDGSGYYWTARRLLWYAALRDLDAVIEVVPVESLVSERIAAWFEGIREGRCHFGVRMDLIRDPEEFVAGLAHEVAHAFRAHYGLVSEQTREEELLTDLTTVYLGFGLLATNAAYRFRTSGYTAGSHAVTTWSHHSLGYLPAEAMAYLLAVQTIVRRSSETTIHRLVNAMETTQRESFKQALQVFEPHVDLLRSKLGIPDPTTWPTMPQEADLPGRLEGTPNVVIHDPPPLILPNTGSPVFRVRQTYAERYAFLGFMLGGVIGLVFGSVPVWIAFIASGLTLGIWFGKRDGRDHCSDPGCRTILSPSAATCPGCGGEISGRIRHENDRLEAAEALDRGTERPKSDP